MKSIGAFLGFFTYYWVAMGEVSPSGPVPIDSVFIYRPDKRQEIWRFIFYMVLHAGMPCAALPTALTALGALLLLLSACAVERAEACSSRSTPKPRPPAPTPRPNVTFHTYACPPAYAAWYCLNGATCFTVKIAESLMYSCECSDGYMGNRCEFKDLDGSYLPVRQRVVLERASVASGASIAVILVVVVCMAAYVHCQRRNGRTAKSPPPTPCLPAPFAPGGGALPCRALPSRPPPGPGRPAPAAAPALAAAAHLSRPPPYILDRDWPWRAPIVVPVVALHRPCRTAPAPPPRPPPPACPPPHLVRQQC
ncbi:Protein spitz [Frankliniella fusca]|uniref:Protein spitz n=1 Tax=Frankliniella fusca TaxID=407009 RepID=A0AAE1H3H7_9NEOP|nr:Protein spitz [Frankliniella fusca]